MGEVELYQPDLPAITTPATLLQMAVSQGADLDKLEKLMALQERYEASEARKAYMVAMTAFKADPPKINKDRHVSFGATQYNHASLASVCSMINSALSAHGLSASWKTAQADKQITVTCCITHILGHQECTSLSSGADNSGGMNAIQGIGSAVSYLQRYTILALTGLATHDADDDGTGCADKPVEKISTAQINALARICESKGYDADDKLKAMATKVYKLESIAELPSDLFDNAVKKLNALKSLPDPGADG